MEKEGGEGKRAYIYIYIYMYIYMNTFIHICTYNMHMSGEMNPDGVGRVRLQNTA